MEASDPLATQPEPGEDPFAEIPGDPLLGEDGEELPPGVEQGQLGGENLSDEEEAVAEPEPGEFLEDPEELPVEEDEEEYPPEADVADVPEQEDTPEAPVEEPPTTVEGSEEAVEKAETEDEVEDGGTPDSEPDPEPESPAPDPEPSDNGTSSEEGRRGYVILKAGEKQGVWEEAFPRTGRGKKSEPATLEARNGQAALRAAYRKLTDDGEGDFVLVAVPAKLFNPKPVSGKPMGGIAIRVG